MKSLNKFFGCVLMILLVQISHSYGDEVPCGGGDPVFHLGEGVLACSPPQAAFSAYPFTPSKKGGKFGDKQTVCCDPSKWIVATKSSKIQTYSESNATSAQLYFCAP